MNNTQAEKLIAAYLSGNTRAQEEEELMAWVDKDPDAQKFFDNAVELWSLSEQAAYPDFSAKKSSAWDALDARLDELPKNEKPKTAKVRTLQARSYTKMLAIAASLALLVGVGLWWSAQPIIYSAQTLAAEQKLVTLPDGTQVWLNGGSLLSYEDTGTERKLVFEGEAYFDVQTDSLKPFQIYAGNALTTVMGTAFNLRAYPEEEAVEVSVTEGKVALTGSENTDKVELTVGQTGVFEKKATKVKKLEVAKAQNKTAWKDKKIDLDGLQLQEAIPVIERYFDVHIQIENKELMHCLISGGKLLDPSLEEAINTLTFILDSGIQKEQDDRIVFKGGSCK